MAKYNITPEQFVEAYMDAYKDSLTMNELANRLGVPYSMVSSRKQHYVKMGVKLPRLFWGRMARIDIGALNELVEKRLEA